MIPSLESFSQTLVTGTLYVTRIKVSLLECGCIVKYSLTLGSVSYCTLCLKSVNHTTGISRQVKKNMKSEKMLLYSIERDKVWLEWIAGNLKTFLILYPGILYLVIRE